MTVQKAITFTEIGAKHDCTRPRWPPKEREGQRGKEGVSSSPRAGSKICPRAAGESLSSTNSSVGL